MSTTSTPPIYQAKLTPEKSQQLEFYQRFLIRVNPDLTWEDVVSDNNDGVIGGNLLEFKRTVNDLNATLFQCIKYLSAIRLKGKPVPANILIVDLTAAIAYLYAAGDYLPAIETIYNVSASRENSKFIGKKPQAKWYYNTHPLDAEKLIETLRSQQYTKIHIDENCIVGWASSYYKLCPHARKEDFIGDDTGAHKTIGEIRQPRVFADYIYPYIGSSNVKFNYLMDRLNDTLQKKNLGAFYTPRAYADKSLELVRQAISRIPKGHDYIIIDRCAGTGNLEAGMTDEELSHCILSTLEYYEYKVLLELLGSKVRHIIPPTETAETFQAGLVNGANALSQEYVDNPIIKQYLDNPKCAIILFENPPYAETTSIEHQKKKAGSRSSVWKQSYVVTEMKKQVKGTASNDLGNAFIWSAFEYYLRQPTDSYIVYSPVKYWKAQHLIDKKFEGGFAFNRRHFHTNIDACIMVAWWSNQEVKIDSFILRGFDLDKDAQLVDCGDLVVKRVHSMFSQKYYDKIKRKDDTIGIIAEFDGTESQRIPSGISPIYNDDMIGYLTVKGNNFDNPDASVHLLRVGEYDGHGFYLRRDNYLEKLPMFAASRYITYNRAWTERARVMKSADGADRFSKDVTNGKLEQFLLQCLLFTTLEMQNHMRTFTGSDGRFYRNQLCLDTTNGDTLASRDLSKLATSPQENALLQQWQTVLTYAKQTANYDPSLTYGVYQIYAELDIKHKDDYTGQVIYDYVELHTALQALKVLVKDYYNTQLVPVLFEYEFLK